MYKTDVSVECSRWPEHGYSKVIGPRVGQQEQGDMLSMSILPSAGDISATLLYSSMGMVWRDVGSQGWKL